MTQTAEPALQPAPPPARRRRHWPYAVMALALALAGTAIGFAVAADHYQPLQPGGSAGPFRLFLADGHTRYATDIDNVLGTESRISSPSPGDTISVGFTISNGGSRAVRIEGIEAPFSFYGPPTGTPEIRVSPWPVGAFHWRDFQPQTLGAGRGLYVDARVPITDCPAGQTLRRNTGYSVVTSMRVRYSFAGFSGSADIPLDGSAVSVSRMPFCDMQGS